MVFLQIGFATSHPRMLKVKVSFKSSPVLDPRLLPSGPLWGRRFILREAKECCAPVAKVAKGITVAAVILSEAKDLN
jgi:hypothetical protein